MEKHELRAIVWLLVVASMRGPAPVYDGGRLPTTARRSPKP
ncbi:MAG: hypothetical protein ACREUL_02935 [Steroidobacteraceae bacterium]